MSNNLQILKDFETNQKDNPLLSTFTNFSNAVAYKKYKRIDIKHWFLKLVNPKDYRTVGVEECLEHMIYCTNLSPKKKKLHL